MICLGTYCKLPVDAFLLFHKSRRLPCDQLSPCIVFGCLLLLLGWQWSKLCQATPTIQNLLQTPSGCFPPLPQVIQASLWPTVTVYSVWLSVALAWMTMIKIMSSNSNNSEYGGIFWDSLLYSMHPFQHRHLIHLKLHRSCEEHIQDKVIIQLNYTYVLLTDVVKLTQLSYVLALHHWSLKEASDIMVGNSRVVITIHKTVDGFSRITCDLCLPLNSIHGRSAFQALQVLTQDSSSYRCNLSGHVHQHLLDSQDTS